MIVFVTFPQHAGTVAALIKDRQTAFMPRIRSMTLDAFLRAGRLPRATYVICDTERMTSFERRLAAHVRRCLLRAGMRCLNDPLRIPTRYGLLLALHRAGINQHRAWRAEDLPRPGRFPVFLRADSEHGKPIGGLIEDQEALDAAIASLPARGHPVSGVLVVEFCAEPVAPGIWERFGTFRIGEGISCDNLVQEDNWCVKYGTNGLATEAMADEEHRRVRDNVHADALRPAFELLGIEWGRADHAVVGGRDVIFEINTNPHIPPLSPHRLKRREETQRLARQRMASLLAAIDTEEGGEEVAIDPAKPLERWRQRSGSGPFHWRP